MKVVYPRPVINLMVRNQMLEIWGRKNSSNVIAVMWAVGELGLKHIRHNVGGSFGGLNSTEYLRMNPNAKVPTVVDAGNILWESNAIVRYLSATYGQDMLWPENSYERGVADQWMDWSKTTLYPDFFPIFWNLVRSPVDQQDRQIIDRAVEKTAQQLEILDQHLRHNDYVAGKRLTMGDIPLGGIAYRYFNLSIERPSLPGMEAWYDRLCQRPAFQQHAMIPFGSSLKEWLELERMEVREQE